MRLDSSSVISVSRCVDSEDAMIKFTRLSATVTLVVAATALLAAGAVPNGKPEDAGFSTERLGRIKEAVQRHIDAGSVPGVVTLVARRGKVVHFETHG